MKNFVLFLIAILLLFSLCACGKERPADNPQHGSVETTAPANKPTLNRLKKVTVTAEGMTIECNVTWEENLCNFESYMNYYKDEINMYQGVFDPQTGTFSIRWPREDGETYELPVFDYDEDQRIVAMYNEDDPSEVWGVTYNQNGVAQLDGEHTLFEYDPATRQVKRLYSSGSTNGIPHKKYDVTTLDANGCFIGVDRVIYKDDGTGNFQLKETLSDYYKYTYDENGNLIRYEEPYNPDGFVIEYQYYDEPIEHLWQIIIPIHYIDVFQIFELPFLWYLK